MTRKDCLRLISSRAPLASLLLWSSLFAASLAAAKAQDVALAVPTPDELTAAHEVVRTPIRMDKNHPLRVRADLYPGQSIKDGEKGFCLIRVQVDPDGVMRAVQLVSSTGSSRLDAACLVSFIGQRVIPATVDGRPVSTWTDLPVAWGRGTPANQKRDYSLTPHLDSDYRIKVGPDYYPAISREKHQEGACLVHVAVSAQGNAGEGVISKSTGYAPLDEACVAAVRDADFVPGVRGDRAIVGFADIYISWALGSY